MMRLWSSSENVAKSTFPTLRSPFLNEPVILTFMFQHSNVSSVFNVSNEALVCNSKKVPIDAVFFPCFDGGRFIK